MTETKNATFLFWVKRCLARFTDYLIWGIICNLLILPLMQNAAIPDLFYFHCLYAALFAAFALYPLIEAFSVSRFGATIGAKLTGLSVSNAEGQKLPFKTSLKRAYLVYAVGLGCFLPVVSLVCPLVALYFAVKGKEMFWDKKCASVVREEKPSVAAKVCLVLFYAVLLTGFGFAVKTFRDMNRMSVENEILLEYWEESKPVMEEIISQDAFSTPENVAKTAENLKKLQQLIVKYHERYDNLYVKQLEDIRNLPETADKVGLFHEVDARSEALRMHWFAQSMRLSMLENIVSFFSEANGKYRFENGQPVFEDPELMRAYQDFIIRISGIPAEEETVVEEEETSLPSLEITAEGAKEIPSDAKK